jgi:uncharacterized protein (UPF0335 family)
MGAPRPRLVKDQPFISQSGLTERWYFVSSWRPGPAGSDLKVAHEKHDITDAIKSIITDAQNGQFPVNAIEGGEFYVTEHFKTAIDDATSDIVAGGFQTKAVAQMWIAQNDPAARRVLTIEENV